MTLKEFKAAVANISDSFDEWQMVIPVKTDFSMGATPCETVSSIHPGLDHNSGKVLIFPSSDLRRDKPF